MLDDRTFDSCYCHWREVLSKKKGMKEKIAEAKAKRTKATYAPRAPKPIELSLVEKEEERTVMPEEPKKIKTAQEIYTDLVASMDEVILMHQAKDESLEQLRRENEELRKENARLQAANVQLQSREKEMQDIAKAFEIARRMMLGDQTTPIPGLTFEMEQNGNLNRRDDRAK